MNKALVFAGVGILVLAGGAGVAVAASTPQARTIRLNNPGALRLSTDAWQGKVASSDKELVAFSAPIYGARAMLINMRSAYTQHGCNTIRKMVTRWSGGENATGYANSVAAKVGISADAAFPWQANTAVQIAKAMSDWETGIAYFPLQLFVDAWGQT